MLDSHSQLSATIDMASIVDQAIQGAIVIDEQNCITYFNSAAEKLWGYSRQKVMGQNVKMLIPSEMRGDHDSWVNNHRRGGADKIVGSSRDVQIERHNGKRPWVSLSLSKVQANNGEIYYAAFVRDITEARATQAAISQTLEQALDAVVTIDEANKVTFFNNAAEKMWGYTREEVLGRNVNMLVPPEMKHNHDGFVRHHRDTGENRIVGTRRDVPIHRKDGTLGSASLSLTQVKLDDGRMLYTAFLKDMAEQQAQVAALGLASQLMADVERMTAKIESISRMTSLLSLNASIEAARAGSAGLGFGVVAAEIRSLAGEASTVTDEIEKLVRSSRAEMEKMGVARDGNHDLDDH